MSFEERSSDEPPLNGPPMRMVVFDEMPSEVRAETEAGHLGPIYRIEPGRFIPLEGLVWQGGSGVSEIERIGSREVIRAICPQCVAETRAARELRVFAWKDWSRHLIRHDLECEFCGFWLRHDMDVSRLATSMVYPRRMIAEEIDRALRGRYRELRPGDRISGFVQPVDGPWRIVSDSGRDQQSAQSHSELWAETEARIQEALAPVNPALPICGVDYRHK